MCNAGPGMCVRNGCQNNAIDNPGWDSEYCSNECVVSHCRFVFLSFFLLFSLIILLLCYYYYYYCYSHKLHFVIHCMYINKYPVSHFYFICLRHFSFIFFTPYVIYLSQHATFCQTTFLLYDVCFL